VHLACSLFWVARGHRLSKDRTYLLKRAILTAVVVFYVSYISLTKAAINVFYCIDVRDGRTLENSHVTHEYWAVDTAVRCFEGSHLNLAMFVAIPVLLLVVLFPVTLALVLMNARHNQKLQSVWIQETVGLFFRGFEEKYVFWDSLILLRKALLAAIVVFAYSLGGSLQGLIALGLLVLSLFLQTSLLPFRSSFGYLNQVENASLFVSCLTFLCGIILSDPNMNSGFAESVLVGLVFVCNVGLIAFLLCYLFKVKLLQIKFSLLAQGFEIKSDDSISVLTTFVALSFDKISCSFTSFFEKDTGDKTAVSEASGHSAEV